MATDSRTPPPEGSKTSEAVPRAAPNEIDALVDAIITGASTASVAHDDDPAHRQVVAARRRLRRAASPSPAFFRWVVPSVGAFAIGILSAAWGLRTFESARSTAPRPTVTESDVVLRSPASASNAVADVTRVPGEVARNAEVTPAPKTNATGPQLASPPIRDTLRRVAPAPAPSLPAEPTPSLTDRPSVPSLTGAALPTTEIAAPFLPSVAPPPMAPPAIVPAPVGAVATDDRSEAPPAAGAGAAVEVDAVLGILRDYEAAYENLDVVAAAEVWPSVDRRALTRAFALLKSQEVAFDPCHVDVTGSSAVARCPGVARYVRRIGTQHPLEQRYEWVFDMRKSGDEWRIESVTASQER